MTKKKSGPSARSPASSSRAGKRKPASSSRRAASKPAPRESAPRKVRRRTAGKAAQGPAPAVTKSGRSSGAKTLRPGELARRLLARDPRTRAANADQPGRASSRSQRQTAAEALISAATRVLDMGKELIDRVRGDHS